MESKARERTITRGCRVVRSLFALTVVARLLGLGTLIPSLVATAAPEIGRASDQAVLELQVGHQATVSVVAFSPDGKYVASADASGRVLVWNLGTGLIVRSFWRSEFRAASLPLSPTFSMHVGDIASALVVSRDDSWIAIGALDGQLEIWSLETGELVTDHLTDGNAAASLVLSPDGKNLAALRDDGSVRVWSTSGWQLTASFASVDTSDTSEQLMVITGAPNVGSTSPSRLVFSTDGRSLVAVTRKGELTRYTLDQSSATQQRAGTPLISTMMALCVDGVTTAAGDVMGKKIIVDDQRGTSKELDVQSSWSMAFDPHCTKLAVGQEGRSILIHSLGDGTQVPLQVPDADPSTTSASSGPSPPVPPFQSIVGALAFSADGQLLASGIAGGEVTIWRTDTWAISQRLSGLGIVPGSLAFDESARALTIAGSDLVRRIDTVTGNETTSATPTNAFSSRVSRNGRWLATIGGGVVRRIDLEDGSSVFTQSDRANNAVAAPDGSVMISDIDGGVFRWNGDSPPLKFADHGSRSSALIDDGMCFASAAEDGSVIASNLASAPQTAFGPGASAVTALATSKDCQWLARGANDGTVVVRNATTGSLEMPLPISNIDVTSLAFSPDGRILVAGQADGILTIWDVENGKLVLSTRGHFSAVSDILFHPTQPLMITSGGDGAVNLWNTSDWSKLGLYAGLRGTNDHLVVSSAGLFDGTADAMRAISWHVYQNLQTFPVDALYSDYYYPLLLNALSNGTTPQPPTDISAALHQPSIDAMLSQGAATVRRVGTDTWLCFAIPPTESPDVFDDGRPIDFELAAKVESPIPDCPTGIKFEADAQIEVQTSLKPTSSQAYVPPTSHVTPSGRLLVQVIGISDYADPIGSKHLPGAVPGAKALSRFFADRETTPRPFRSIEILPPLYDSDATLTAIRDSLSNLATSAKRGDTILLYLSGHGIVPAGQEMFYFSPYDVKTASTDDIRQTGLSTSMIAEAIERLPARNVALIIDACQSGGVVESLARLAKNKASIDAVTTGESTNIFVIASATPFQVVDTGAENDPFVTALLGILREREAQGIRIGELAALVQRQVKDDPEAKLDPLVTSYGSDFALTEP